MKKSDKKLDNQIRELLTDVCEEALVAVPGFEWLTHQVNYSVFPSSLVVSCIFTTRQSLDLATEKALDIWLRKTIAGKMKQVTAKFNGNKQVRFDTEEECLLHSDGNWQHRLAAKRLGH